ncbi:ClpP/crotonase-like domain-containing protein [Halteromyces radiatus]|uniref:ClpP/crotonase-like domain-containing protein n=1 Tax=Halteromyces radiatus TaxID=101107 RepID=UPI00221EB568|nr:ClpP/crotonase-like domain-containing protein [Halteromyces radiatus]KAI8097495.1 ClpP/crotonase-like domain-containing protein [Halteromyces radiatus]
MSLPKFQHFETTLFSSGVYEFAFNRPHIYNALNQEVYQEWRDALLWAAKDDRVKVFLLTGRGKYYCSGQQLYRPNVHTKEGNAADEIRRNITKGVVTALIDFPKLIIAAVNGPAYGFAVTSLALCDVVYATPDATFTTPFMKLGFCSEACSSYTFPRIMGNSKANEMLLMGRTMTVEEMVGCGFVSRTISKDTIRQETLKLAEEAALFSPEALKVTKDLIRHMERPLLHDMNDKEMIQLHTRVRSPESIASLNAFVDASEKRRAERQAAKSKL